MTSNASFNDKTGAIEVAEAYPTQAVGKIVLVIGVRIGNLGEATTRAFAHVGASTVVITGREDANLIEAQKAISADYPKTKIQPIKLDLASFSSIKAAADKILNDPSIPHLDLLILNAGGNIPEYKRYETADGLEYH
ncbi:hypothetical protein CC80DRAFT_503011 [Byssothecium circinans]|uniref:NAD(P)-binding protein n=1 Tax=Byssothecium circinans TaxID=147558 RepID=A0A6A5U026_9PLEO|nr:hypothetical protein CC80DRAFT_503011 [Byssothecium circinans]